jgi:hypothetical protein
MSNQLSIDLADDDLDTGGYCLGTPFHDQGVYNGI